MQQNDTNKAENAEFKPTALTIADILLTIVFCSIVVLVVGIPVAIVVISFFM